MRYRAQWLGVLAALWLAAGCDDDETGGRADAALPMDGGTDGGPAADAAPPDAMPDATDATADAVADGGTSDGAPPDAAPRDAAPRDAAPRDAAPIDAGPSDAAPTDAAPHDGAPGDAAPRDAAPHDARPRDAAPADAAPADAAPDAGPPPGAPCEADAECLGWNHCVDGRCAPPPPSPLRGALVLDEILIDGAADEDANGDGDIDAVDDEFVEIVNAGDAPVDLSGFLLVEADLIALPRHTFPPGFGLAPGEAVVVFGGGSPSADLEATPGATFVTANAADPAFSNGLHLDDAGDVVRLLDAEGRAVFSLAYGDACDGAGCPPAVADRSLTRRPALMGPFVPHDEVADAPFSPGTRPDGAPFGP